MFYAYMEEYSIITVFFKDKTNLYNMCKIKLHKTSKFVWPVYIDEFVVKWVFFFDVFINHFLKIHKSVLHKITIDVLYFLDVYEVYLWEKVAHPVGQSSRHVTGNFTCLQTHLVTQNRQASVRLHHCPQLIAFSWQLP